MIRAALKSRLKQWQLKNACRVVAYLSHRSGAGLFEIAKATGMWRMTCAYVVSQCEVYHYVEKLESDAYVVTDEGKKFLKANSHLAPLEAPL